MSEWVSVGSFCPNTNCPNYGKVRVGNLIRYGKSNEGRQGFQCKTCLKTFNEGSGTQFYKGKTEEKDIPEWVVVTKYVIGVVLKRGRVTDPSLRNALFYSCSDNFITYHLTTIQLSIEQKFKICQWDSVRVFKPNASRQTPLDT